MSRKLDRILVIDVEITSWEEAPPPGQEPEILQIGVCTLEIPSKKRIDKDSFVLRLEHSTVTDHCTQRTAITQEEADAGLTFKQACAKLRRRYHSGDRVWASYGDLERRIFEKQCRERKVDYPLGPTHINVRNLLALMNGLDQEVELAGALEIVGAVPEGTLNRAADDAWNVAAVLADLLESQD